MLSVLAFQCTISKSASVMQPFYQYSLSTEYTSRKCWENKNFSLEVPENFLRSNTEFYSCLARLDLEKANFCCLTYILAKAQNSRANPQTLWCLSVFCSSWFNNLYIQNLLLLLGFSSCHGWPNISVSSETPHWIQCSHCKGTSDTQVNAPKISFCVSTKCYI